MKELAVKNNAEIRAKQEKVKHIFVL